MYCKQYFNTEKKGGRYTLCTTIYCNAVKPVLCDLPMKHCNRVTLDRLLQSSKWKFEFTGANQILEHILYTVELRSKGLSKSVQAIGSSSHRGSVILERKKSYSDLGQFHNAITDAQ
jgi:hypothetical protein